LLQWKTLELKTKTRRHRQVSKPELNPLETFAQSSF
jgi:hypothetical protein